jgi:hypothetical protein
VNILTIPGLAAPVKFVAPGGNRQGNTDQFYITNDQYTGFVTWNPTIPIPGHGLFEPDQVYTATIALTAKEGYTFNGVTANAFKVGDVTGVSAAGTGTTINITFTFPKTEGMNTDNDYFWIVSETGQRLEEVDIRGTTEADPCLVYLRINMSKVPDGASRLLWEFYPGSIRGWYIPVVGDTNPARWDYTSVNDVNSDGVFEDIMVRILPYENSEYMRVAVGFAIPDPTSATGYRQEPPYPWHRKILPIIKN